MTVTLEKMLAELPADERASIEARAKQLIAEEMTLQDLRKARSLTQERMAERLGIGQDSVSRLEKRSDLLLSTLRGYVAAMGGNLRLIVEFPDRPSVDLSSIMGEAKDAGPPAKAPRPPRRRTGTGKQEDHPSP
jgi:DNA-binding XRE family transcriptional regulator